MFVFLDNNFFQGAIGSKKSTASSKAKSTKQQSKKPKYVQRKRKTVRFFRCSHFREQTSQRSEATNTLENVLTNILDQRLQAFLNDSNTQQLQFEDGLSPFGRRYVHEVCERRSLKENFY
jgi:hypothetical protein